MFDVPGSTNFMGFKEINAVPKTISGFSFGFPVVKNTSMAFMETSLAAILGMENTSERAGLRFSPSSFCLVQSIVPTAAVFPSISVNLPAITREFREIFQYYEWFGWFCLLVGFFVGLVLLGFLQRWV